MRYSLGDTLADYGFSFLEKLHNPVFLLHKSGRLKRVNEAGRKLIRVARLGTAHIDELRQSMRIFDLRPEQVCYRKVGRAPGRIKIIVKQLGSSDYVLLELTR